MRWLCKTYSVLRLDERIVHGHNLDVAVLNTGEDLVTWPYFVGWTR